MKRSLLTLVVLSTVLLSACSPLFRSDYSTGSNSYDYDDYESSAYYEGEAYAPYDDGKMVAATDEVGMTVEAEDRKIIKTGSLTLHMESVQDSVAEITKLIEDAGGSVQYSNITRGSNSYSGSMTVKVPSDAFDTTIEELKEKSVYVASEYTNASDVTEYYMDLETRLTNKQAEEAQYLDILTQANTVTDILSVTQYLSNVRYEIESLQGQLKSYDSQIDYSTISLYLSEDESLSTVSETWKPDSTVKQALSDWVVFLQGTVDGIIYLLIFGWPLLVVVLMIRSWLRKRRKTTKK